MRLLAIGLAALGSLACAEESGAQYLRTIQQRWDASNLVCVGDASEPERTGAVEILDGAPRDQLVADVELENCCKGQEPQPPEIRVFGDDVEPSR